MSSNPTPPRSAPLAICGTCSRRLTPTENYDGEGKVISVTYAHPKALPGVNCKNLDPVILDDDPARRSPKQVSACDFCGGAEVCWDYPAGDFASPGDSTLVMTGAWVACEPCHADVECRRWDRLAERHAQFNRYVLTGPKRNHLVRVYRAFNRHRAGPATPF